MPAPSFGIDHIVVLVRDLDAAARDYEKLGFTTAPQMRHAGLGTANRIVLFDNNFIELIGIVDKASLGGVGLMIADHLERDGEGPFGLALASENIARDRARLAGAGLIVGEIGGGSRPVPLPDGTMGEARFSTVTIGGPKEMPFLLFMCEQHVQSVVWIREWQRHANGAHDIAGLTLASSNPQAFVPVLSVLCGADGVARHADGIKARLPQGTLNVLSDAAAARQFPLEPSEAPSRIIAAQLRTRGEAVRIPADKARGIVLEFESA